MEHHSSYLSPADAQALCSWSLRLLQLYSAHNLVSCGSLVAPLPAAALGRPVGLLQACLDCWLQPLPAAAHAVLHVPPHLASPIAACLALHPDACLPRRFLLQGQASVKLCRSSRSLLHML